MCGGKQRQAGVLILRPRPHLLCHQLQLHVQHAPSVHSFLQGQGSNMGRVVRHHNFNRPNSAIYGPQGKVHIEGEVFALKGKGSVTRWTTYC